MIMNDRADLCLAAGFDGVHVGQDDLSPAGVRKVIGERFGSEFPRIILSRWRKRKDLCRLSCHRAGVFDFEQSQS